MGTQNHLISIPNSCWISAKNILINIVLKMEILIRFLIMLIPMGKHFLLAVYTITRHLNWNFAAENLLLHCWDKFNFIQSKSDRRIYKGLIAYYLAKLYSEVFSDIGAATHWALLTHSDDGLAGHLNGMGGRQLQYRFGMSEEQLSHFNEIINLNAFDQQKLGWSEPNRFADDMLVQFILNYPQYAHLFANPTLVLEFPPCIPYLEALWEDVKKLRSSKETNPTGNALEYLAAYLFLLIPGFIPRSKVIKDFENDLVISNYRSAGNIEAELFGRDFLVECKNRKNRMTIDEVSYFLYRMRLTHTKFGVIFANKGITGGKKGKQAAMNLCQRAFHEDNSICIVVEDVDIVNILGKNTTFRSLLLEKSSLLRFGKQRQFKRS